jgi:hypothetical protein
MSKEFKLVSNWRYFTGQSQITYKTKNANNETIYYCLQDNGPNCGGIKLLRCTSDYEPSHTVTAKNGAMIKFQRPDGSSKLEQLVNGWIDQFEQDESRQ